MIGGGNTAIDVVREAGASAPRDVTLVYRRTEAEMPAYPHEVEEAREEGVEFLWLTVPVRFLRATTCHRDSGASSAGGCSSARPTPAAGRGPSRFPGSEFVAPGPTRS